MKRCWVFILNHTEWVQLQLSKTWQIRLEQACWQSAGTSLNSNSILIGSVEIRLKDPNETFLRTMNDNQIFRGLSMLVTVVGDHIWPKECHQNSTIVTNITVASSSHRWKLLKLYFISCKTFNDPSWTTWFRRNERKKHFASKTGNHHFWCHTGYYQSYATCNCSICRRRKSDFLSHRIYCTDRS